MANTLDTYTDRQIMKCLLTRNFTAIGRAFEDNKITKLKPAAFYQAQNLDRVTVPKVTEVGALAFAGSTLSQIDIAWDKLENIGYGAFSEIGSALLPENLNLASLTVMDNYAFAGSNNVQNESLKTVSLPLWTGARNSDVHYSINTNNKALFSYCPALTSISAPELVTLPQNLIYRCNALTELNLPKAANAPGSAFNYCTNLVKIKLGGAITNLNSCPFTGCTKMEAFILPGITAVPSTIASNWSSTRLASGGCFIYVPSALVNTMKVTSGWSTYADQIRAIEDYPEICG